MKRYADAGGPDAEPQASPVLILVILLLVTVIAMSVALFYHSLEEETYAERTAYLKEISGQIAATADAASSAQWDLATMFSNRLQAEPLTGAGELAAFLRQEEGIYAQQGLSLLVFDARGNYFNAAGDYARWQGSVARLDSSAPERQVEITTLPTSDSKADEMVFVRRLDRPVQLQGDGAALTHVAVVRDMTVFNTALQVSSFSGQGETYIISSTGTKVYREQTPSAVLGDVYNVLKPLEGLPFRFGGSYETLRQAVAAGQSCSLAFYDAGGACYYVTTAPMAANGWSMLSVIPSEAVSVRMQAFMHKTLFGMGAIALAVIVIISLAVFLVVRFKSGQKLLRQQAEANAALREAARAAEEASRAKTVFLSHMSHDIRTPINGIMGMADIATRNMGDAPRVADCLGKITSASHHLLSLVNDVLDMSRIESGKVQLEEQPFYLHALLDGCYSVVAGQAMEKKLALTTDFHGVSNGALLGDELHLRQILINILGNAVKFTPEGGRVEFTAQDARTEDGQADLTIIVRDSGIGMTEDFQKQIFEPFVQDERISRSDYQGTGLGMSIVKQLLDLMGGSIGVESAPGKGSAFTVRLRLPAADAPAQAHPAGPGGEADLSGMRALLVEDNALNMEIAKFMLEDCGIQVTPAWNGQEAVDTFIQRPAKSFDIILMDLMMPVMDGLAAARAIRESGKADAKGVAIVAMTANAFAEDRKAVLEAGMDRHLTKPIEREELLRALRDARNGRIP